MKKLLVILLSITILLYGCENKDNESKNNEDIGKLVTDMYNYANEYDYDNMRKYFDDDVSKLLDGTETANEYIDLKTKEGNLKDIKVLYTNIKGSEGTVRIEKTFNDGEKEKHAVKLKLENDEWKIEFKSMEVDYIPEPKEEDILGFWYGDDKGYVILKKSGGYWIGRLFNSFKIDGEEIILNKVSNSEGIEENLKKFESGKEKIEGKWKSDEYECSVKFKDNLYRVQEEEFFPNYASEKEYMIGIYIKEISTMYTSLDLKRDGLDYENVSLREICEEDIWDTEKGRLSDLEFDEDKNGFKDLKKSSLKFED
ncbi:MAG: hypothetical protein ABF289_11960 [Clostridiales bacterium]